MVAWLILGLTSSALFGNFYVYDSIGPIAELLQKQRGFSDSQIGMLNAIYSLPNVVLVLVGGILVDRFGAARITLITATLCLAGALLTAFSPGYVGMAAGRLLFGIGAETFNIGIFAAVSEYFEGGNLAFALALNLSLGRAGSYAADMSPTWFAHAYAEGWQAPLVVAAMFAAASFAASFGYWWTDAARRRVGSGGSRPAAERFVSADLIRFGAAYWYLLILCILWYAVILAFRSTFSIKYFQHAHGLSLEDAGAMNSYVFLAAMFATPLFGWLCDKIGRYAPILAFGAILLPMSIAVMALTNWDLWIATTLIGVSFSLVPAVMWPLARRIVPACRFGTAIGLMWVAQNAGIAGANLVAGWLNDLFRASAANPAGYQPMMIFFGGASLLGFAFAMLLWLKAGGRTAEAAAHSRASGSAALGQA